MLLEIGPSCSAAVMMQVLIVGSEDAAEFENVILTLRSLLPTTAIRSCLSVDADTATLPADLVLILQQWPDQFARSEVLTLINNHPLGRLVVCHGPWCDSDGRTRHLWPHGVRVSIAEAPSRLIQEIRDLQSASPPLPLTATREESYEHSITADSLLAPSSRRLGVLSADAAFRDWMCHVLRSSGHLADEAILPKTDGVVWDADPWSFSHRAQLESLKLRCKGRPIIAICGFPRRDAVRELMEAGADLILPKVFNDAQLLQGIESTFDSAPDSAPTHSEPLHMDEAG